MKTVTKNLLLFFLLLILLSACGGSGQSGSPSSTLEAVPVVVIGSEGRIYQISQADSTVSFTLSEMLMGQPTTVIGSTNLVSGQIAVNLEDLSTLQLGPIQIDARGFATDNNMRNRAIHSQILETSRHPTITFTPTLVNGLPDAIEIGQEITFTISGDITIREISEPVVFTVTAKAVTADQISGTATATVSRADFDLRIPNVPSVADVSDEVELTIQFVANSSS
ncbi:MAG: YceI family protein [Anaerolineae bacterium]|nr:YceI family protein [Anaerolineae bacterium]